MKKYILLISSVLLLIISFFIKWYEVELLNKLFIFYLLIQIILFIILLIIINKIIKELHKKNIINIITLIIIITNILLVLFFPFREFKTIYELKLYETERNKVLNLIKDNKLKPDKYNNISLPKSLKKVSISGEVTLYQNNEEGLQVGFWIYRGLLSSSEELIYASSEEQIINNDKYNEIIKIKKLKDNWYYVITKY